jgi:hypothetical protein
MEETGRTEAADAVERALTDDGARVLLRDKHVARTGAALMIPGALLFLLATVAVALGADPSAPRVAALIPFALFAAMAYTGLANMVVRSAVTEHELRVQWGMRRITVPLAAITRCEAKPRTGGATAATGAGWSLFADRGAVALTWDEGGAARSALIPAHDPEALAQAIEAARGGHGSVRIDAAEPAVTQENERAPSPTAAQNRAR